MTPNYSRTNKQFIGGYALNLINLLAVRFIFKIRNILLTGRETVLAWHLIYFNICNSSNLEVHRTKDKLWEMKSSTFQEFEILQVELDWPIKLVWPDVMILWEFKYSVLLPYVLYNDTCLYFIFFRWIFRYLNAFISYNWISINYSFMMLLFYRLHHAFEVRAIRSYLSISRK